MKSYALILFGLAVVGFSSPVSAGGLPSRPAKTSFTSTLATNPAVVVIVGNRAKARQIPNGGPARFTPGPVRIRPIPGAKIGRPLFPAAALKPGVYMSLPYTCMVVVPPSHLDDKFIFGGGKPANIDEMPMINPHLHFIPLRAFPLPGPCATAKTPKRVVPPGPRTQAPRSK
jgi:hypothetical protein